MKKLSKVRGGLLPITLLLAVAGMGCDDGDNTSVDMGSARDLGGNTDLGSATDMGNGGTDSGPQDQGFDAGPVVAPAQVRVVQAVSDLTSGTPDLPINGIRLCIETPFGAIPQPANADLIEEIDLTLGIPHRAVTPYLDTLPPATVRVYDEALVDDDSPGALPPAVDCPVTSDGSPPTAPLLTEFDSDCTDDTVPCLFQVQFDPSALVAGEFYSLILRGFQDNANTCGAATPCPTGNIQAQILTDEDASDVVAGSARVRFSHLVHNLPPVDVCYDLDGLTMTNASPTLIHAAVTAGNTSPYVTVPAVTTGMVFLTMKTAEGATQTPCGLSATPAASGLPSNVIPVFFSPADAVAGTPNPGIAADTVLTIFLTGDANQATQPSGTPTTNPVEWAHYASRAPLPLAFFEVAPAAP